MNNGKHGIAAINTLLRQRLNIKRNRNVVSDYKRLLYEFRKDIDIHTQQGLVPEFIDECFPFRRN